MAPRKKKDEEPEVEELAEPEEAVEIEEVVEAPEASEAPEVPLAAVIVTAPNLSDRARRLNDPRRKR